jgi:AAA+ superfamily predicted ATPase
MVISDTKADRLMAREDLKAERQFYKADPEAARIGNSLKEALDEIESCKDANAKARFQAPLDVLTGLFGLNAFERDVLLLCLAPELDPKFARIYAYIQDDINCKYPTPHLALSLFGGRGSSLANARLSLMPKAALRQSRLLVLEPGHLPALSWGQRPLKLEEGIVDYLLGGGRMDGRIASMIKPVESAIISPTQKKLVEDLLQWILSEIDGATKGDRRRRLSLNLFGPKGSGRKAVACALCRRLGLQLFILNWRGLLPAGPEREEIYRLMERDAVLFQAAYYIDAEDGDAPGNSNDAATFVEELASRLGAFFILGSTGRWRIDAGMISAEVPKPNASARYALWKDALSEPYEFALRSESPGISDEDLGAVVQQFEFGPEEIAQAARYARDLVRLAAGRYAAMDFGNIWQACREIAGQNMGELAQRIVPVASWDDIVLPEDALRQLKEIAAQMAGRQKVYDEWGFGRKLSKGRGISALFSGPSGTGKTMAAEVLAKYLNLDLYRIDLAGVVSKYIGETEKNLRKVFDAAEESGAILFFDEADALFGKRTEVKDSHDRYANIEIDYLLQRMEDYRGLAILATNRRSALDQAFLRRLRFLIDLPLPDLRSRKMIWQKVFPREASLDGLEYDILARMEISGGNIRNIALNAAFLAASEGMPIGMNHIMSAARREYIKINKMITESEFGRYYGMVRS